MSIASSAHLAPSTPARVGELYRALARRLEQIVRVTVQASDPVVEDACQFAWGRLLAPDTQVSADATFQWLAKTAIREAWRLRRRTERDVPLPQDDVDDADVDEPTVPLPTAAVVERRDQLRLIRQLPERQQRILWLRGLGLSYEEIAAYTGDSIRTVERQLLHARRQLKQLAR